MANSNHKTNLGIFGLGNMGQAIFKLLLKRPEIKKQVNFYINSLEVNKVDRAVCLNSFSELAQKCHIIFLCVKPQNFYQLKPLPPNNKIFISIMAGVKIANLKKISGSPNIIRVMPNLPLQVGQGIIAWFAQDKNITRQELAFIKKIFSAFGYVFRVKQEADLDKITAISGSGPAYVFLFIDALIKSAVSLGFVQRQAEEIVLHLLTGSLAYFKSVRNIYRPEQLIQMVKSKKGTTEAALNKLNVKNFYARWQLAINQAYRRARQISDYDLK